MATGGNFTQRLDGTNSDDDNEEQYGSTEAEDSRKHLCAPCRRNKMMKTALHYCPTCDEVYCNTCVHFHSRMALLKDHFIFNISDKDKFGRGAISSKLTAKCNQHPSESVTMVCVSCNELCCHVCIPLKHSYCIHPQYIHKVAKGIRKSSRKQGTLQDIQKTYIQAIKQKNELDYSLQNLTTKQASFLKQIKETKQKIDNVFKEIENRVTSLGNTLHESLSEDIKRCNDLMLEMYSFKDNLQNTHNKDESQVFIDVVQAENRVKKADEEIDERVINQKIKAVDETDFSSLYQLHIQVQLSCSLPVLQNDCRDCEDFEHVHLLGNVVGICQLPDGTFVLADSAHFKLIQLSKTYNVIQIVNLKEVPSAVCNTEPQQIAVSLKRKLIVFNIDTLHTCTYFPIKDVLFSHRCCGLSYYNEKYYISDNRSTVYQYNINGACQKVLGIGFTRMPTLLFKDVRNIAIGKEAKKIYVTDIEKGLITMDLDGNVLSTLEVNDTKGAYGVCVTDSGNVLVTNYLQDKVVEINPDGTAILQTRLITLPKDQSPRAICFDSQTSNILVSENPIGGSNRLRVIKSIMFRQISYSLIKAKDKAVSA